MASENWVRNSSKPIQNIATWFMCCVWLLFLFFYLLLLLLSSSNSYYNCCHVTGCVEANSFLALVVTYYTFLLLLFLLFLSLFLVRFSCWQIDANCIFGVMYNIHTQRVCTRVHYGAQTKSHCTAVHVIQFDRENEAGAFPLYHNDVSYYKSTDSIWNEMAWATNATNIIKVHIFTYFHFLMCYYTTYCTNIDWLRRVFYCSTNCLYDHFKIFSIL